MSSSTSDDAPVVIVPYRDSWPAMFSAEAQLLEGVLGPWLVAQIEHIGSTAVPGLQAKPIIDIMAPVQDLESSVPAIEAAKTLSYCHYPYKPDQMHWFCKPNPAMRTHHLHLIPYKGRLWQERLAFRDALRADPRLAQQYGNLKLRLAARHPVDREAYTQAKAPFVASVLRSRAAEPSGAP